MLLQAEVLSLPVTLHLQKVHAELLQDTAKGGFHLNPKPPRRRLLGKPKSEADPCALNPKLALRLAFAFYTLHSCTTSPN